MMEFDDVSSIDKISAEMIFASSDERRICQALISLAFHEPDWQWVQDRCLLFLQSDNPNIAGVSATCFGHIARIHHKLEMDKVIPALREQLNKSEIAGIIEDTLDDIDIFIKS